MILLSLAIAATVITISQTLIFKPLRTHIPIGKKLIHCPYCLAHWFSFFAAYFLLPWSGYINFGIKTMALVALSSIISFPILLYLNLLEKSDE